MTLRKSIFPRAWFNLHPLNMKHFSTSVCAATGRITITGEKNTTQGTKGLFLTGSPLINILFSSGQVLILQSGEHFEPLLLTQGEVLTTCKLETRPK